MRLVLALLFFLLSMPVYAQLNYTTYAAGGPTPCLGCGAVLSTGTVANINFNWGGGQVLNSGRSDGVVVRFTGFLTVPGSGSQTITFYNSSDDGVIVRLNGVDVLSDWQEQGPAFYNGAGTTTLTGGQTYALEVWYYENGGGAAAQLYWNQTGSIQLLPNGVYTTTQPVNPRAFGDGGQALPATSMSQLQQTKIQQTVSIGENSVYIQNYGDNTNVLIEQNGNFNSVRGVNGVQAAVIDGSGNVVTIKQGTTTVPGYNNLTELAINGASNTLTVNQRQNGKYVEAKILASLNNITVTQEGASKSTFLDINGNSNTIGITQQGAGSHFFGLTTAFSGSNVTATQTGEGQKLFSLTINSPNVGVTINQLNATTGDSAAMTITCTTGPCNGYTYTKN